MKDMENNQIVIYQTEDGQTQIDVRMENDTVWLTQAQMVELFQTTKQNISLHIGNVYKEGELEQEATVKEYLTVQTEGSRSVNRQVKHYNLDVIISEVQLYYASNFPYNDTEEVRNFWQPSSSLRHLSYCHIVLTMCRTKQLPASSILAALREHHIWRSVLAGTPL